MARIALGALTTLNLSTHLDPMFVDLYNLRELIATSSYSVAAPAFAIDGSLRVVFGATTAITTQIAGSNVTPRVQAVGADSSAAALSAFMYDSVNASAAAYLYLGRSRGSLGAHGACGAGDLIGRISFAGSDGSDYAEAARIQAAVDTPAPGVGDMPGRLTFFTSADGSEVPSAAMIIDSSQHTSPGLDNTSSCGIASRRWSVMYAASGTINTSDAREKTEVAPLSAAELAAAQQLGRELGTFRFLAAVAAKGDAARLHVGMTVQRAIEIMAAHALDPLRYGFICHDTWPEEMVPAVTREEPTGLLNQDGSPNMRTVVLQPERVVPAGDRYSFRTDELLLFIARGLEARIAALEAR